MPQHNLMSPDGRFSRIDTVPTADMCGLGQVGSTGSLFFIDTARDDTLDSWKSDLFNSYLARRHRELMVFSDGSARAAAVGEDVSTASRLLDATGRGIGSS